MGSLFVLILGAIAVLMVLYYLLARLGVFGKMGQFTEHVAGLFKEEDKKSNNSKEIK